MASLPQPPAIRTIWQLRAGFGFGATNALTWIIALGSPMVLLLEALGASPFQVGLAHSFVLILAPIQVLSTALLPKLGFRRQVIFAWTARGVFIAVPTAIVLSAPVNPAPWMPSAVVAAIFFFCLFRAIGSSCYAPWIYALLPDNIRGRYFSTDSLLASITGVATLVFCSWSNANRPPFTAFTWQLGVAMTGAIAAVYFLSRIPDAPAPKTISLRRLAREIPRLIFTPGKFRYFLGLSVAATALGTPFAPFTVYFLKVESQVADSTIFLFSALQYFGAIVGSSITRSWIDRLGTRPFLCITLLVNITMFTLWILYISTSHEGHWIGITFFIAGIAQASWFAGQMKYLPQLSVGDDDRPVTVSTLTSVVGVFSGITPILWGILLKSGNGVGINHTMFLAYFFVAILGQVLLLPLFLKIADHNPGARPIHFSTWLSRPFRFFSSLPLFQPDPPDKTNTP